jgi:hypothetical protein
MDERKTTASCKLGLTSSGYQTPGFVLPSSTALANAAIEMPTLLQTVTNFINILAIELQKKIGTS